MRADSPHLAGHPPCSEAGEHVCAKPSGRTCFECKREAGTKWSSYWCPDCDSRRLARISDSLELIAKEMNDEH